jgi:hypothetical protein
MNKQPTAIAQSKSGKALLPLAGTVLAFITMMAVGIFGAAMVMSM